MRSDSRVLGAIPSQYHPPDPHFLHDKPTGTQWPFSYFIPIVFPHFHPTCLSSSPYLPADVIVPPDLLGWRSGRLLECMCAHALNCRSVFLTRRELLHLLYSRETIHNSEILWKLAYSRNRVLCGTMVKTLPTKTLCINNPHPQGCKYHSCE